MGYAPVCFCDWSAEAQLEALSKGTFGDELAARIEVRRVEAGDAPAN